MRPWAYLAHLAHQAHPAHNAYLAMSMLGCPDDFPEENPLFSALKKRGYRPTNTQTVSDTS